MNFNILAYSIYLPITFYIMIVVGRLCYIHGEIYLAGIFKEHHHIVRTLNNLLLLGYYLVNLGYAAITLSFWPEISSATEMVAIAGVKLGQIILLLGLLHANNMLMTYWYSKKITQKVNIHTS